MQLAANDILREDISETEPILHQFDTADKSEGSTSSSSSSSSSSCEITSAGVGELAVAIDDDTTSLDVDESSHLVNADLPQCRICLDIEGLHTLPTVVFPIVFFSVRKIKKKSSICPDVYMRLIRCLILYISWCSIHKFIQERIWLLLAIAEALKSMYTDHALIIGGPLRCVNFGLFTLMLPYSANQFVWTTDTCGFWNHSRRVSLFPTVQNAEQSSCYVQMYHLTAGGWDWSSSSLLPETMHLFL